MEFNKCLIDVNSTTFIDNYCINLNTTSKYQGKEKDWCILNESASMQIMLQGIIVCEI